MENKRFIFFILITIASSNYGMQGRRTQAIINICTEQQKKIQESMNKSSKEEQLVLKNTQIWWQQVLKNIRGESIKDGFVYETTSIYILATLAKIRDKNIVCDQKIANELKELLSDEHKKMITMVDKTLDKQASNHKTILTTDNKAHQKVIQQAKQKKYSHNKSPKKNQIQHTIATQTALQPKILHTPNPHKMQPLNTLPLDNQTTTQSLEEIKQYIPKSWEELADEASDTTSTVTQHAFQALIITKPQDTRADKAASAQAFVPQASSVAPKPKIERTEIEQLNRDNHLKNLAKHNRSNIRHKAFNDYYDEYIDLEKREGLTLIPRHIRKKDAADEQVSLQSQAINLPPQAITPQNTPEDRTPASSLKHNAKVFIPGASNQMPGKLFSQNLQEDSASKSIRNAYLALPTKQPKN